MTTSFWEGRNLDQPHTLGGFNGTWAFSDHSKIPQDLFNFILESFHPVERIKRIPIEDINKLMNDVWEGPGSMVKVERLYNELKNARIAGYTGTVKMDEVKTIDDYTESDFQVTPLSEKELATDDDD